MKNIALISFIVLLVSCSNKKSIDNDCEYLKSLLPEASINFSEAVDDDLDIDDFINTIKKTYKYHARHIHKNAALNDKGINTDAFADAIAWSMKKNLRRKDSHISVSNENIGFKPFLPIRGYLSDVLFTKKDEDYYVLENYTDSINIGMKYTGDLKNIVTEFLDGEIIYRYVVFSDIPISDSDINLEGKSVKVNLKKDKLDSLKGNDIWYEKNENVLKIYIKTFHPHFENNIEEYEKVTYEICQNINDCSSVVFDFRDNSGGEMNRFIPILATMIFGKINLNEDERIKLLKDYIDEGEKSLVTETVQNRQVLEGVKKTSFYHENKSKKYFIHKGPEKKLDFLNKAFNGNIYVVMNSYTGSAAEYAIASLKEFFGKSVITIGTKSAGMVDFGGAFLYVLPDSKVKLNLCFSDFTSTKLLSKENDWHGDTEGFYPDYWIFSEKEIEKFINN